MGQEETVKKQQEKQKQQFDKKTVPRTFSIGNPVWVRNCMVKPKWIKGTITQYLGNVIYKVQVENSIWKHHANQLRSRLWDPISYSQPNESTMATQTPRATSPRIKQQLRRYPERCHKPPGRYGL